MIERSLSSRALNREDLPTFTRPAMTTCQTLVQHLVEAAGGQDPFQGGAGGRQAAAGGGRLDVLVLGELDARLGLHRRLQQGVAQRRHLPGKPPLQVVEFHQRIALRVGLDEVVDRLGLQQVQLAVAEGAVGELAGQRRAGAAAADQGQRPLDDEEVGMQRDLGHVLAAVGSGPAEEHRQAFVDALRAIVDEAVVAVAGPRFFGKRGDRAGEDVRALAPGKANDGDAGPPRRRGQGNDRLVIHSVFCGW